MNLLTLFLEAATAGHPSKIILETLLVQLWYVFVE